MTRKNGWDLSNERQVLHAYASHYPYLQTLCEQLLNEADTLATLEARIPAELPGNVDIPSNLSQAAVLVRDAFVQLARRTKRR